MSGKEASLSGAPLLLMGNMLADSNLKLLFRPRVVPVENDAKEPKTRKWTHFESVVTVVKQSV